MSEYGFDDAPCSVYNVFDLVIPVAIPERPSPVTPSVRFLASVLGGATFCSKK
jgi:hypothetical protein